MVTRGIKGYYILKLIMDLFPYVSYVQELEVCDLFGTHVSN